MNLTRSLREAQIPNVAHANRVTMPPLTKGIGRLGTGGIITKACRTVKKTGAMSNNAERIPNRRAEQSRPFLQRGDTMTIAKAPKMVHNTVGYHFP